MIEVYNSNYYNCGYLQQVTSWAKVVIEELPDENPVIPQSRRMSKEKGSTSCKKRLLLKCNGTKEYRPEADINLGQQSGVDESLLDKEFDPF